MPSSFIVRSRASGKWLRAQLYQPAAPAVAPLARIEAAVDGHDPV
jgi:hypothetical protein